MKGKRNLPSANLGEARVKAVRKRKASARSSQICSRMISPSDSVKVGPELISPGIEKGLPEGGAEEGIWRSYKKCYQILPEYSGVEI